MAVLIALVLIYAAALAPPQARVPTPHVARPTQLPGPEDPAYQLLVENASMRAFLLDLAPGAMTRTHTHERDLMLIAASPAQFTLLDAKTERFKMGLGELQVLTGMREHRVRNDGRQPLRLVAIELGKPFDPKRAVCGLGERPCGGEMGGSLTQGAFVYSALFETDNFRVVDATLDPRALAERFPIKAGHLFVPITSMQLRRGEDAISYEPGQAVWAEEGFTDGLENVGEEQARWVAVEVR